jgi:5-methylcytosine-specific restriction endonuclease McrA
MDKKSLAYRAWQKAYDQRPEVKERKRKYMETYVPSPEVAARHKAYKATKEYRDRHVQYIRKYRAKKYDLSHGTCPYCGDPCSLLIPRGQEGHGQVDHVVPISLGGADIKENRQLICAKCNAAKANMLEADFLGHIRKIAAHLPRP